MKKILVFLIIGISCLNIYSQKTGGVSPSHSVVIMGGNMDINAYIKEYVETKISEWQKKGEFEKTADYKKRVTEEKRRAKADQYASQARNHLEEIFEKKIDWSRFTLGKYDADNESFLLTHPELGEITLSVPISVAPDFKDHFSKLKFSSADFVYANNQFNLSKLTIKDPVNGKQFQYDSEQSATYVSKNIDYNFTDIEVKVSAEEETYTDNTKIKEGNLKVGSIPVDTDIPKANETRDKTFALVIGNEDYSEEQKVPFAKNDARVFKKYCNKTLGLPSDNIHLLTNATLGQMLGEINWLSDIAKAYKGEATLIFYYAGHGMPDERTKDAYLLPIDGSSEMTQTALKVEDLYKQLNKYPVNQVTVFMDACFSGASRNGMLADGRGVKIEPKENAVKGNMVVISAASGKETAYPYTDKGHGMFTYYLLKKLHETKGNIDLGELSGYLKQKVEQKSVVKNNKPQNPKVNVSNNLQHNWKNLKIAY